MHPAPAARAHPQPMAPPPLVSGRADDPTLVGHLMAAAATVLDRCEAARRRKLPFFGSSRKAYAADQRAAAERAAVQRAALAAARVGLPQVCARARAST